MQGIDLSKYDQVKVHTGIRYRSAEIVSRAAGDGKKVYEFTCSSEAPVENRWMWDEKTDRYYYGTEVLLHGPENVDMSWIASGNAPFLRDHDTDEQCGVILGAELKNRTLIVNDIKFSRSQDGQDLQADIDDGIRKNVSIGYIVEEIVEVQAPRGNTQGIYHATKWKPYEVSSVSIPAVEEVGFGRSKEQSFEMIVYRQKTTVKPQGEGTMDPEKNERGNQNPAPETPSVNVPFEAETDASRIHRIADLNRSVFPEGAELASRAIAEGKTSDLFWKEFQPALLKHQQEQATVKIGMSDKEKSEFRMTEVIRYLSGDKSAEAKFEREVSEEYCKKRGISSQRGGLIIPHEALQSRAAIISSTTGAGAVQEVTSGEVIEYLRANAVAAQAGARMIGGLVGKFDMCKIGVGSTAYWVGEIAENGSDITTSAMDLDLLQFTLKTIGVNQGVTRQMLKQTSLDVEAIVRGDLFLALAAGIDAAALAGTGSNNQPTGIVYTTSVNTEEIATAATPLWADVVNMETAIAEDNALRGAMAYVAHPTIIGKMKQTLRDSGVAGYVMQDGQVNGYRCLSTTAAAKSTVKQIILGNWNELMIGMWGGVEVIADPYTYSRKGIVSVTAFQEVDVQVRHPESFCYITVAG